MHSVKRFLRWCFYLLLLLVGLILIYRDYNPYSTLMLRDVVLRRPYEQHYVPLSGVSRNVQEAVIAAEDAQFCQHNGVDWNAIRLAVKQAIHKGEGPRGASTLTMQLTRNLFLWQGRSYIRKFLEVPLSLMLDAILTKRRIMELYLNIAEWGDGIYGVEAAARHHFGKSALLLTPKEASLLVSALPSPIRRDPGNPGAYTQRYASKINRRIDADTVSLRCLRQ